MLLPCLRHARWQSVWGMKYRRLNHCLHAMAIPLGSYSAPRSVRGSSTSLETMQRKHSSIKVLPLKISSRRFQLRTWPALYDSSSTLKCVTLMHSCKEGKSPRLIVPTGFVSSKRKEPMFSPTPGSILRLQQASCWRVVWGLTLYLTPVRRQRPFSKQGVCWIS